MQDLYTVTAVEKTVNIPITALLNSIQRLILRRSSKVHKWLLVTN